MVLVQRYGKPDIFLKHHIYVIEHQKRGLPHAHFLIILRQDWKLYAPESFDEIVSAELPDKDNNLHLYTAVIKHMMHGPCGVLNPTNVCMKKNGCCKNYPKQFVSNTVVGNDCFPIYKRCNNGRTAKIRGHDLDNRWVVPYNPYLLAMFDCHINVEICSTIKAVKYLYKYIYKGHDRVAFNLRWITPPEAMWRIFGFIINEVHPAHQVTFRAHENLTNVINSDFSAKSMLTEFFATNQVDQNARKFKSFEGEMYYLRMLLNHIRGPLSFDISKLSMLEECLYEASLYQMPFSLRRLFATILVYCNPTNPRDLWERFEQDMSADFQLVESSSSTVRTETLRSISTIFESMGRNINSFHLINQNIDFDQDEFLFREIDDELAVPIPEEDLHASTLLNCEQQNAYNSILQKVLSDETAMFFIDGPGGTGKTFLYKALLATRRTNQLIALATVSSGVAASILPGGRTAHSRFKIPLHTNKNLTCSVSKQSGLARLLQKVKLIIWDEAPMSRKESIEALDKMLKDINDSELSFGRKVIVFGGDFRQILPVVPKGTRQQQIDASLVSSYLWPKLTKIRLTENMRARLDPDFSKYILDLGNGLPPITINECVRIPAVMLIPYENDAASLDHLVDTVFHNISDYSTNISSMMNRAILTPKNSYVDEINTLLIQKFPGELKQYYSFDETIDASEQAVMEDFLHTLTPNGLPPHELLLKQNCPIMLLRNINPSEGLCNGTRLICRNFDRNVIHAEIAVGHHSGKNVFIPRIPFLPNRDENSGFPFKRTQFPVKLSFAMSINKSQGQTLDFVGIYLPHPVFSHGQLYVALSRAKTISAIKILIRPISTDEPEKNCTKNIVYTDLLTLASSD
ncbi:hypothetical protein I3843_10G043700 [Carya illinoinensis]|nr:hypothetical protein I3843_10G043700 [Carya illinoinensis]